MGFAFCPSNSPSVALGVVSAIGSWLLALGSVFLWAIKSNMSFLVTLPSFPVPLMVSNSERETPSSFAIFFTNGEKNLSESEKFVGEATDSLASSILFSIVATSIGVPTSCFAVSTTLSPCVSIMAMV